MLSLWQCTEGLFSWFPLFDNLTHHRAGGRVNGLRLDLSLHFIVLDCMSRGTIHWSWIRDEVIYTLVFFFFLQFLKLDAQLLYCFCSSFVIAQLRRPESVGGVDDQDDAARMHDPGQSGALQACFSLGLGRLCRSRFFPITLVGWLGCAVPLRARKEIWGGMQRVISGRYRCNVLVPFMACGLRQANTTIFKSATLFQPARRHRPRCRG